MIKVHATCVEVGGAGVLLRGVPGSGKSDLALRLIGGGARLVADDYTEIKKRDGCLAASAPEAIAGMMEVRGIGLIRLECAVECTLRLVVDLVPAAGVERLPDPETCEYLGISLPLFRFSAFEESTVVKIRLAAGIAGGTIKLIE
ncbi:MAG: hypothetical protein A3G18_12180 [Rhodospirillales bacterium RIFCSPLOWO2_12_FULL_58_28]|nr:MAG: hypothetical protein A3H92_12195 [Rhodospirillales bacterium RIFCSPLOWO2_02_FULL_58_16]OHC79622.1 MAG: hypothetical protein A3G18_12180 [Rhodospirillales bacterium RIFCSPLOWO2_12_FULL_58_28]